MHRIRDAGDLPGQTLMAYTAQIPATPGLRFTDRSAEGILEFYYGASFDKTITPQYSISYTATIENNGAQVAQFNIGTAPINPHFWGCAWWYEINAVTTADIKRTAAQLQALGVLPPIGSNGIPFSSGFPIAPVAFSGPMGTTPGVTQYEPTTGGSGIRGIVSEWGADEIINGNFSNLVEVAKAAASMPIWFWEDTPGDPGFGKVLNLVNHPKYTSYYDSAQGGAPNWLGPWPTQPTGAVAQPWVPDNAHFNEVCGLLAMMTGAPRYVRALQMREADAQLQNQYWNSAAGYPTASLDSQIRAIGWHLRELFYTRWATYFAEQDGTLPKDCLLTTYYDQVIADSLAFLSNSVDPELPYYNALGVLAFAANFGPWQHDFISQSLAMYAKCWPATWGPIYIKTLQCLAARTNADGLNQWPAACPTAYYVNICSDSTVANPNGVVPFTSWKAVAQRFFASQAAGTDIGGNNGWVTAAQVAALDADPQNGGVGVQMTDYNSIALGALAQAVDLDRGVLAGAVSKAYPNLENAYAFQYEINKAWGQVNPTCSMAVMPSTTTPGAITMSSASLIVGTTHTAAFTANGPLYGTPAWTITPSTAATLTPVTPSASTPDLATCNVAFLQAGAFTLSCVGQADPTSGVNPITASVTGTVILQEATSASLTLV